MQDPMPISGRSGRFGMKKALENIMFCQGFRIASFVS